MSRYLFTTLPSNDLGLLTRSLPIAAALARRRHEVLFCSPGEAPRRLVAEAGFANVLPRHPVYYAFAEPWDLPGLGRLLRAARRDLGLGSFLAGLLAALPTRLARPTAEVWSLDHLLAMIGMGSARFLRAGCQAVGVLLEECCPDVVVDFWNPLACVAARAAGLPLVTVIQADGHPANRGFLWWRQPPQRVPTILPALNEVRAGYGLPSLQKVEELWLGDATLVVGMPKTDPLPPGAAGTYVGALLWQRPGAELPAWVQEMAAPLVWLYMGNPRYMPIATPMDTGAALRACLEALGGEPLQVVLTTGHHALPRSLQPLPGNVRLVPYVPGLAMARCCDLLIHHGGYGSCQTGLYAARPALVLPTFSERESNARRVVAVEAGEMVVPRELRGGQKLVAEVRAQVQKLLAGPTYRARAGEVSAGLQSYGGAEAAAELIACL